MTKKLTIGIGLSGGADSSFAAFLLKQQGCDVHAFTMRLQGNSAAVAKGRRVAEKLDIPFQVLELQDRFEQLVLAPFVESYARGFTPSPCVLCNRDLKFGLMGQAILRLSKYTVNRILAIPGAIRECTSPTRTLP